MATFPAGPEAQVPGLSIHSVLILHPQDIDGLLELIDQGRHDEARKALETVDKVWGEEPGEGGWRGDSWERRALS